MYWEDNGNQREYPETTSTRPSPTRRTMFKRSVRHDIEQGTLPMHHPSHLYPPQPTFRSDSQATLTNPPPKLRPRPLIVAHHKHIHRQDPKRTFRNAVRAMYNNLYFKLPHLYYARVQRIFEEARLSKADLDFLVKINGIHGAIFLAGLTGASIGFGVSQDGGTNILDGSKWAMGVLDSKETVEMAKRKLEESSSHVNIYADEPGRGPSRLAALRKQRRRSDDTLIGHPDQDLVFPRLKLERFMREWGNFVDDSLEEWNVVNIVNALLLSAILTLFQVDGASNHKITRIFVFFSLICALISLVFGSAYTLRFKTMKTVRKAANWVEEADKSRDAMFWNVWIILSLPAVWLTWSIISFIASIMIFLWTSTDRAKEEPPLPDDYSEWRDPWVVLPRIAITFVFICGVVEIITVLNMFRGWAKGGDDTKGMGIFPAPRELFKRRERIRIREDIAKEHEEREQEERQDAIDEHKEGVEITQRFPNEAAFLSRF